MRGRHRGQQASQRAGLRGQGVCATGGLGVGRATAHLCQNDLSAAAQSAPAWSRPGFGARESGAQYLDVLVLLSDEALERLLQVTLGPARRRVQHEQRCLVSDGALDETHIRCRPRRPRRRGTGPSGRRGRGVRSWIRCG